jgi:FHA domain-containing protein
MPTPAEVKRRLDAERRGAPFLQYLDGDGAEVLVELEPRTARIIGRRADSDIALEWDTEVSRLHAQLEPAGRDWTLVDDGLSRNGTFVNGERIDGRRRLRDGDRMCFGGTHVLYRAPGAADSISTAAVDLSRPVVLSDAQRRVLVALCRPLAASPYAAPATNREIASALWLSTDAVKAHLRVLFERFELDDLPQNTKRARLAALALVGGVVRRHEL